MTEHHCNLLGLRNAYTVDREHYKSGKDSDSILAL